ncbi:hypothetical protein QEH56_11650 [Pelagicoccus enzymogenes]|uniref:hypothetical protein n=1 Tax=Pelagicoccus enzymogenes TaxID=2773457 RepID=UPI00280DAEC9|nr:hypothetical protein [Pelagicoccus enzymogenes]MDQ8198810.1 hypothetical protein [Pelagicoccus enzymogenes]
MKFANPNEEIAAARDQECLRKFLAGNKTAFAQAFWENAAREACVSENSESLVVSDSSDV